MFIPSSEWLPEERLQVIFDIATQMQDTARSRFVSRSEAYAFAKRVEYVSDKDSSFLEANREAILLGRPIKD